MPRPSNDELTTAYMHDLETEIRTNEEQIASGRADLIAYNEKCKGELATLFVAKACGATIATDRYGIPSLEAGKAAEIEALKLIRVVIENNR